MNKQYLFLFLLLLGFNGLLFSQSKVTTWKGFQRHHFQHEEKAVQLTIPGKALPGKPWIWRARFPGWHTEADSILVAEGFHLVYINTNNQFGSPKAVKVWNSFYHLLTSEYQLHEKVALMGVSRGGLFVYNWAKANPDKVTCIYAEAPVCDFKSWPAGFGESQGSKKDWITLKKEYGFANDDEARQHANNPIDGLEVLANNKIPILHMIGLQDKIVPVEENTLPLVNRYISLGGIATVVPCTRGKQKLQGHHFPIETPRVVADFIKYHSMQYLPLAASDYHQLRGGLQNSHIQFERNKKGRVAFLGGSITYNSGWRDSVMAWLQARFPETEFEFIAAGIPSMGTTPAAFRLERDVLSKGKIDLLFEEAAVNDASNGRSTTEQIRAMEGILRHCRISNPDMDIILMHFVDPDKMKSYNQGLEPAVIRNHNRVATHYDLPTINLAREVTDRIKHGEFTWEDDFKNLHPSPFGQGVYARSMIRLLSNAYSAPLDPDDKISARVLPEPLDKHNYGNGQLVDIKRVKLAKGWYIDPIWKPNDGTGTRANYVDVPMLIAHEKAAILKLKFEGQAIGIAVASGQDAGSINYRIDKKEWRKLHLPTKWSQHLHLPWYYTLASELSEGKHLLELRMVREHNKGKACRIRYFFVNGK